MSSSAKFPIDPQIILPAWPGRVRARACVTTRLGGDSQASWTGFNLGDQVGDLPERVHANRRLLRESLNLPAEPVWLRQVHGNRVLRLPTGNHEPRADAAWTDQASQVCAVLTADCLPVLFCDRDETCVAAAHAGWRGLAGGILEATVAALPAAPENLIAWLGPAIGPRAFEVGQEVLEAFTAFQAEAETAFVPTRPGRWLADIYQLARQRLRRAGVEDIHGGGFCTHQDQARFYSYRRDGQTGRMASLIWLSSHA